MTCNARPAMWTASGIRGAKGNRRQHGPLSERVFCSGTTKREPQCCTDLLHPFRTQAGDTLAQTFLGHGYSVMQVYRASALHPIIDIQYHLGRHVSDCRGDRGYRCTREMANRAIASEYEYRPPLVRRRESAKMNITAVQSSGQAAASSQGRYSSVRCGWA